MEEKKKNNRRDYWDHGVRVIEIGRIVDPSKLTFMPMGDAWDRSMAGAYGIVKIGRDAIKREYKGFDKEGTK